MAPARGGGAEPMDRHPKENDAAPAGAASPEVEPPWAIQPPLPIPARAAAGAAWPAATPDGAEAADALLRSLAGTLPDAAPLAAVAGQVVASLSALEREVLAGDPQGFDPAPVRAAAVMRLRVAAALAAAPQAGVAVDGAALQGILGEIDGLLAEVKVLLREAPEDGRLGLEAIRNALVREAIEFSEAAGGRAAPAGGTATPAPAPGGRAPATRPVPPDRAAPPRRPTALLLLLGLVAAPVLGYHGWHLSLRPAPEPPPTFEGAPAGTLGTGRGARRVLTTLPGRAVDAAELERFRRLEASRGNVLRAVSPGTWVIEPAGAAGEGTP